MTLAFVDSGAWIALMVPRDQCHSRARDFFRQIATNTRLLTSDYVVAETVTWLVYHGLRREAWRLKEMLDAAESTRLLDVGWVTPALHDTAWTYLQRFDDQDFSFCDCTSFALCEARQVDYVFGFDRHFLSAGLQLRP